INALVYPCHVHTRHKFRGIELGRMVYAPPIRERLRAAGAVDEISFNIMQLFHSCHPDKGMRNY
ncbi:hypothetical protein KIH86_05320, partial [Paenibacillus sp. HN-1]|uniref:hypothetical protein n=1 Tax=Paenibacillus sinensis TaxID=2834413 RepID=UPI001CA8921E